MTICARFDTFHVSIDGEDIVYGGRLADGAKVEIRQAVTDADVMVVLLASVLKKSRDLKGTEDSHPTDAGMVQAAEDGGLVLSLVSRDIRRSFRLDRRLALALASEMNAAATRPRLRAVT